MATKSLESTIQRAERYLTANYARFPVTFVRGEGCWLWDAENKQYLDFLSGIGVINIGHCHPDVVAAVRDQVGQLMHVSNLYHTAPMVELAQRLSESSLGGKVFFCNSGAEANEAAIKLARKARPRGEIIVFEGGFHGRTYGALSATPQPAKQEPFAPLVPGFIAIPKELEALQQAVTNTTAAVLLEPIQGETGVNMLSNELLAAARTACDRVGAALIFDEVQCGLARTGTLWAYEQTGVKPDLLTVAKALAGGLPIGALVTAPAFAAVFEPGDHGSTFAGGPAVAEAALAAWKVLTDTKLHEHVQHQGKYLRDRLKSLPGVQSVRGRGLMVAAEIDQDAPAVVRHALLEHALLINATGPHTLRFLPPLTVTTGQIDLGIEKLASALNDLA